MSGLAYNKITQTNSKLFGWITNSYPQNSIQLNKFLSWNQIPQIVNIRINKTLYNYVIHIFDR